ncbi:MAG: endonuclease I family protein [Desulfococcaceae bacterium]
MKQFRLFQLALFLPLLLAACFLGEKGNTAVEHYAEATDLLEAEVYPDHRRTFYCDCAFSKSKRVRCNTGAGVRATRVEWEHVVPASRFGHTFEEWKSSRSWQCRLPKWLQVIPGLNCKKRSGRENARRKSREYRYMEADMHNLVPAVGLINQRRSNRPYGMIPGEPREFGRCDFEVTSEAAEPTDSVRGDIARTVRYMVWAYEGRIDLSRAEEQLMKSWEAADPVDDWECTRSRRIEAIQGNENPFVKAPCRDRGLW